MNTAIEYRVSKRDAINQLWRIGLNTRIMSLNILWLVLGLYFLLVYNIVQEGSILIAISIVTPLGLWPYLAFFVSQHPEILEVQKLTYDEEGINISNSVTTTTLRWDRLKGLIVTKNFYLLRTDSMGSGGVIPKAIFSKESGDEFLELLKEKSSLKTTKQRL